MANEIILITGGSGFLGQHIIKLLQEKEHSTVKEIRVVDLEPYKNQLGHVEKIPVRTIIGDICDHDGIKDVFQNVETVFHCAAHISLSYPIDTELERVNVHGTENVIRLCKENNVKYLIFTSDLCINLTPWGSTNAIFSAAVNCTESKSQVPLEEKGFLIPGYPHSKAKADKLVVDSHGQLLANGDKLYTCSLRPTFTYGEGDKYIFSKLYELSSRWSGQIPRIAGDGGKHQLVYVGNVAWAHLCARKSLKEDPIKIGGLPVFITDETPIYDITRFANILCRYTEKLKVRPSTWKVPMIISYFVALLVIMFVNILNRFNQKMQLKYDPRGLIKYNGSLLYWNRMRASIHMNYFPIYTAETAMRSSALWYEKWYYEHVKTSKKSL